MASPPTPPLHVNFPEINEGKGVYRGSKLKSHKEGVSYH